MLTRTLLQLEALALPPTSPHFSALGSPSTSGINLPSLDGSPITTPFVSKPSETPKSPSIVAKKDAGPYSQRVILTSTSRS